MNSTLQKLLEDNIDLAISNGYSMNRYFSLEEDRGRYLFGNTLSCHPLETVIVGESIQGPINVDIANRFGVHPHWVDGFIDGYRFFTKDSDYLKLSPQDPAFKRYMEGFKDGQEVAKWIEELHA